MHDGRRYGIITDIHANLAALRAVLDALAREDVSAYLCMGDVVGYGPSPAEAIAELRKLPLQCIQGNHDRYTLGQTANEVRAATAEAIEYTRRVLCDDDMAFLRELPDEQLFDGRILLAHGSPRDPDEYIMSAEIAITNYKYFRAQYNGVSVCLFGHTHVPTIVGDGRVVREIEPGKAIRLKHLAPYLINPGSVGQPRDGNPDAAFAVLDLDEGTFTFHRVPYDVEDTYRRILEAGLQRHLGDRLRSGR